MTASPQTRIAAWRRRLADDTGSASLEAVLWMPVFIVFIALVFDASMILMNRAHILRAVQDANRAFAVGRLETTTQAAEAVAAEVARYGATVHPGGGDKNTVLSSRQGSFIQTIVRVRAGDLSAVGLLQPFANLQLTVYANHLIED